MAIGTAAAIGLGVAGVGSALSASSNRKAASQAADTSLAVAQQNNALAREIYGNNQAILSPYVARGNAAGNAINSLLGLGGENYGGPQQMYLPGSGGVSRFGDTASYGFNFGPDSFPSFGDNGKGYGFTGPGNGGFGIYGYQPQTLSGFSANPVPQGPPQNTQADYEKAFDNYRNSTGYQFRLSEGNDAINSGYAARGALRSGAALKSLSDYNQNVASAEFGNYLSQLANQQGVGLSAGSAVAGIGQNYVNNVSANNNSAGTAAANAALVRGQNNPFASFAGTLGGFASSFI